MRNRLSLHLIALFAGLCLFPRTATAEEEVLPNQQEAEKRHLPAKDVKTGWRCVSRGGSTIVSHVTREYDLNGNQVGGSSFFNSTSHSGTVAAVPLGDFNVLERFLYRGTSRGGSTTNLCGMLVSVKVQISTGNGSPADMVKQRAVENMTKSGVPLPAATGAKPGRLLPVLESAKRRFGARNAKPRYDAQNGFVLILLLDCSPALADDSYLPATLQGSSREQRLASAKQLQESEDKGGLRVFASETEIIPVGSRRVPFNDAPVHHIP